MFAVPGWSVPTSSLVTEQVRSKKTNEPAESASSKKSSKKRKRNQDQEADHIERADHGKRTNRSKADPNSRGQEIAITPAAGRRAEPATATTKIQPRNAGRASILQTERNTTSGTSDKAHDRTAKPRKGQKTQTEQVKGQRVVKNHEDSPIASRQELGQESTASMQGAITMGTLTPLQAKMRSKLTSARFRHLNETLYTTTSSDALNLFTSSPELFADYHAGFSQQVKDSWPQNPVDEYVKSIKTRGKLADSRSGTYPLPRRKTGSCTIADLGCGDAPLARGCQSVIKSLQLKFHNYDLHAANTLVTQADISNLPLRDGEADIAVFCLSLMGTNWVSFVEEAWRILRGDGKGEVWVAEVKSRFGRPTKGRVVENSVGKRRKPQRPKNDEDDGYAGPEQFAEDERNANEPDDETEISAFVKVFTRRGFQLREGSVNKRNKMFVSMIFTKTGIPTAGKYKGFKWTGKEYQKQQDGRMRFVNGQKDDEEVTPEQEAKVLKPCVYKIR